MRWLVGMGFALGLGATIAMGCATPVEVDDDGSGGTTASSGGAGGMGGASSSSSSMSDCPIDCSTVTVDQCFESVCNPTTKNCEIVPLAAGTACDDELFCTLGDTCDGNGDCVGPTPNDCGMAPTECENVACNEAALGCDLVPKDNGEPCTDLNDLCMVNTTCQNGLCIGGVPKDCFFAPVPNACHVAVCNPSNGMCVPIVGNEGQDCTDPMDLCTVNKTCSNGTCVGGGPKDCSGLTEGCVNGVCDPPTGTCVTQPVPANQPCASGSDACNSGICDAMGQCNSTAINIGMMCDDGLGCTSGETCDGNGSCPPGSSATTIYFYETFANNNAGWTLGNTWQIGPATVSSGEMFGGPDPASDTTPSYDDGVAGVMIGGNAPSTVHPFYFIESPVINTAGATTLVLEFERWLNSSIPGFATDVIEVFDGSAWQSVYSTAGLPMGPTDMAWQHIVIDISTYANANMRVRFGYDDTIGLLSVSSWNIDDLIIASAACN